ncbi:MAG: hypothetical protein GY723_15225 [bacterium]|nr:hypothetical protein [bacterium]MCP5066577.1 hypothetical protein [bacterium]
MLPQHQPDRRIWLDGALVPWAEATVHVLSHSHARGSMVFDFMSVHETPRGAAIFRLPDHVDRFLTSVRLVGLPLRMGAEELASACKEAVRANPGAKVVKLQAFLPSIEIDVVPVDDHVAVAVAAFDPRADVLEKKQGPVPAVPKAVKIWLEKERKQRRPDIMHPHAKVAANYTSPMAAKWAARKRGYDEVLLVDEHGFVAEGPTTNFFLVDQGGVLRTPPDESVLLGVTRRSILALAEHAKIPFVEEPISIGALSGAAEAFLTGTTAGVWPIASVDDQALGGECPGPISRTLGQQFREVTAGKEPAFASWLHYVDE